MRALKQSFGRVPVKKARGQNPNLLITRRVENKMKEQPFLRTPDGSLYCTNPRSLV